MEADVAERTKRRKRTAAQKKEIKERWELRCRDRKEEESFVRRVQKHAVRGENLVTREYLRLLMHEGPGRWRRMLALWIPDPRQPTTGWRPASSTAVLENLTVFLLELVRLKELPYNEYLQTEHWRATAEETKRLWHGECALDERHEARDAHHRTYKRLGWELPLDVVPLCGDCHSLFHGK